MQENQCIEYSTLRVPYEVLNEKFKTTQKILDKEVSQVESCINEVEKMFNSGSTPTVSTISKLIDDVVERLQELKKKADEGISEELSATHMCKRRLEHLKNNPALVQKPVNLPNDQIDGQMGIPEVKKEMV